MEDKLAAYRARKAKEKAAEQSLVNRLRKSFFTETRKNTDPNSQDGKKTDTNEPLKDVAGSLLEQKDVNVENLPQSSTMFWTLTILKLLLWLCIWGIFVEIQFGAVYFTISLILFIYYNTRSGKTDKSLSAYSVFNKDCERIQGTLTAEQMQREMFRVPGLPS